MRSFIGKLIVYLAPTKLAARFVLKASYYDKHKINEEQVNAYAEPIAREGGRNALLQTARQCVPVNSDEIIGRLKSITVPALILWGKEDAVIPLRVGELLDQALPDSKLEVIAQCGHIPQEEKPEETIAIISRFMKTVDSR